MIMKILQNKKIFITGGSRGIGAAIVRRFAEEGAAVGFSYQQNEVAASEVIAQAQARGAECRAYPCDVCDAQAVAETLNLFLQDFGGIDILVNNAGIIQDTLLISMSLEEWQKVITTNLTAAYLHTHLLLKTMIAQRKGVVINISSVAGQMGNVGQTNYAASKAGLEAFTKSVAKEVGGRQIRCNAIAPGIIETDMTSNLRQSNTSNITKNIALKRFGMPEEVADVAVFLASDRASYITGQVLNVCGGLSF
jgi:3-oxoacyl-[acyl-carrier protein] reductase